MSNTFHLNEVILVNALITPLRFCVVMITISPIGMFLLVHVGCFADKIKSNQSNLLRPSRDTHYLCDFNSSDIFKGLFSNLY